MPTTLTQLAASLPGSRLYRGAGSQARDCWRLGGYTLLVREDAYNADADEYLLVPGWANEQALRRAALPGVREVVAAGEYEPLGTVPTTLESDLV